MTLRCSCFSGSEAQFARSGLRFAPCTSARSAVRGSNRPFMPRIWQRFSCDPPAGPGAPVHTEGCSRTSSLKNTFAVSVRVPGAVFERFVREREVPSALVSGLASALAGSVTASVFVTTREMGGGTLALQAGAFMQRISQFSVWGSCPSSAQVLSLPAREVQFLMTGQVTLRGFYTSNPVSLRGLAARPCDLARLGC